MTAAAVAAAQGTSSRVNHGYSREIEGVADNDFFFFEDYYYTAGIELNYRRLIDPQSRIFKRIAGRCDSAKLIIQYHYGIKIFNPFDIETSAVSGMDRPYAGWNGGSVAVSRFPTARRGDRLEWETGVVGKASGMEQFQLWVHKITTYDPPLGWKYQIRNELITNLYYAHFENWRLADDADLISQSAVQAGTGGNKLSQDVTLRLIQFNSINNSAFGQTRLSWDKPSRKSPVEIFIFGGWGVDYVISSVFIEGSLFSHHESPFTVPVTPWVFRRNVGIMFSTARLSCSATFNHLSQEVRHGTVHDFANVRLAVRF